MSAEPRAARRGRAIAIAAVAAAAAAVLAGAAALRLRPAPAAPARVVVAALQNDSGDAVFDRMVPPLLQIDLGQSQSRRSRAT